MRERRAAATAGLLLLVACGPRGPASRPGGGSLAPGDHEIELRHGGRERLAIVHVPPAATSGRPLPLVLAFHGGGSEPATFQEYAGLDAVADREGFVVAYPYGTGPLPRRILTWNGGSCCGYAMEHGIDDVGFAVALLENLRERSRIDPRRVYSRGAGH